MTRIRFSYLIVILALFATPPVPASAEDQQKNAFEVNYELTLTIQSPETTFHQNILIAAPRFDSELGKVGFEGRLTPLDSAKALLEYQLMLKRDQRSRWHASVLIPYDEEVTILTVNDTQFTINIRPST